MKRSPNDGSFTGLGMSLQFYIEGLESQNAELKSSNNMLGFVAVAQLIVIVFGLIYFSL